MIVLMNTLAADQVPQPTSSPPTSFLSSSYVYILVVGVLAVVPLVFGIVLCKKAREKRSKVQYVRGEELFPTCQHDHRVHKPPACFYSYAT